MLFGFGRVPGCLGLGALFLWDEWRDERTVCQRGGCMVVPGGSLSVLVLGCEGVVVCREGVGYQRCAGWLQGLSFLVVCWEMVWHRRCAGCGWGEFCGVLS